MAHYQATVSTPRTPADVFGYLSDFRCVADWDPSITSAELTRGSDPREVGARFHLVLDTVGRGTEMDYELTEISGGRFVVRAETRALRSVDTVTVRATDGGGSAVTYDAQLRLKGARKVVDPLLAVGLRRLSDRARAGLHAELNARASH